MASEPRILDLPQPIAVVSITAQGTARALRLMAALPNCTVHVPARHTFAVAMGAEPYGTFRDLFPRLWMENRALVCIMATGIVVRAMAPLLRSKKQDPAVVVVDERGRYVISLLSGHVGGANRLAQAVASLLGGEAVITTASDVSGKPAVDSMAVESCLEMEDMTWAARVTTAILEDELFWVYDPDGCLERYRPALPSAVWIAEALPPLQQGSPEELSVDLLHSAFRACGVDPEAVAGVWVSERLKPESYRAVVLRARTLCVGVGCNRHTPAQEIFETVQDVFSRFNLAPAAIRTLASVDIKAEEPGLHAAAHRLDRPLVFYPKKTLEAQWVPNPSPVVRRHLGVSSVCEAAALMASRNGRLIVEKQKTRNVTVAVAKDGSGS